MELLLIRSQDILQAQLKCVATGKEAEINKHLVVVLDTSGSMARVMPLIRAFILALYRLVENEARVKLSVLAFDETARIIWASGQHRKDEFVPTVEKLGTGNGTNLEAGFKLGHAVAATSPPGTLTHLYFLTDGEPSVGETRTEWFRAEAKRLESAFCSVVAIGFLAHYSLELMQAIGRFTHVESEDAIAVTVGQLVGQLLSTRFVACAMTSPTLPFVGAPYLGHVAAGSSYSWMFEVSDVDELVAGITITYADMTTSRLESIKGSGCKVTRLETPSAEMQHHVFAAIGGKMSRQLAEANFHPEVVARVEKQLAEFEQKGEVLALPVVVQIRGLIRARNRRTASAYSGCCERQSSSGSTSSETPYAPTSTCLSTGQRLEQLTLGNSSN